MKVRRVITEAAENEILEDLQKYKEEMLSLGASDVEIITADAVIFDQRVRLKCFNPRCYWYGTNAQCPPHAPGVDFFRKTVSEYRYALFYRIKVPSEDFAGDVSTDIPGESKPARRQKLNYEIASKIEARAFYEGYYLASGFAGGPCKPVFCLDGECTQLITGKGCRAPLRSRMSMEGAGMNAMEMASKYGWQVYPCGRNAEGVPHGTSLGIIFIF
jgi:predicted metal-binding protein